ncbi:flagellar hook-associated protein FlgK [uncultured Psychromonas sp.]|uniref:flagellar hook-associated protein FlgK n=1 Tax=uncultured Psychromonas sp. TaxID=173974 RepID=UPI002612A896|nr:flagellar hook-associated protein FlgK [uncultured Psychromonas sp.]
MADLLQIGLSGIYSSQASLATTSHNISNVSTEGYSRQTVDTSAAGAQRSSTNFIGSGSVISSIDRAYDQFAFTENVINTSSHAYYEQTYTQANQMDLLLSSDSTSATTSILNMFSSLSSVADNPSLLESRNVFLNDASSMVNQYNTLYSHLKTQYESINADIENSSDVITELAQSIASLNSQISIVTGSASGGDANDLLDKRNLAITELSEYVNTSVVEADNNMVNIFIGSGQGLVMGNVSQSVIAVNGDPDPTRKELALNFNGQATAINGNKLGSGVAALFNSRDNDLEVAMNQLGQSVIGLTHAINEQQKEGQTLNGEIGADIFNDINSTQSMQKRVLSHDDGLGKAILSVRIDDLSELSADEFTLKVSEYTAGSTLSFTVTNKTTGASQDVSIADLSTEARVSIPGAGISIGIDSIITPLEEGKEFTLRPTRNGAMEASVQENEPEKVAAADAEIKAFTNTGNTGSAEFRVSAINNKSDRYYMDEDHPLTIKISSNTSSSEIAYNLFDKDGSQVNNTELTTSVDPLTGKAVFVAGGVEVEMKAGFPVANDEVTLTFNETGEGDNRNMLAITDLQNAKVMNGNQASFQDVYNNMLSEVGAKTANADIAMQSASILKDQSFERIQNISGVNMDEEAANLMLYQQYYSASARVITVANEVFESLLQASR